MFSALFSAAQMILRKTLLFIVAGIMCLSSFSAVEKVEPTLKNSDTGDYFLPNYGETLIAAHRAGKGNAPENTMMAVKNCLESEERPDIFEMDIQITKDGELVLYHSLFVDEKSDAEEHFGKKNTTVFSKTYAELRELNFGEKFKKDGEYPYAGLRGDDIPDDLRITKVSDVFDTIEAAAPGEFRYIVEIKYPFPWAPKMVDKFYDILAERNLTDRVIIGSFWNDVGHYIDNHYAGKLMRSANPFEIVDFYGCALRDEKLNKDDIKFMALQMPYYWDDGKLLVANLGRTKLVDYAHKYGISVQYWTVDKPEDAETLIYNGADVLMSDHPERMYDLTAKTR